MSEIFSIEIPIAIAKKVERTMLEKKLTLEQAIIFLVEKVSTPCEGFLRSTSGVSFLP